MNTYNLGLVLHKMKHLDRLSSLLHTPEETLMATEEEKIDKMSDVLLSKNLKWRDLKPLLLRCGENSAVEMIILMEQYVREGELCRLRFKPTHRVYLNT